MIDPLPWWHVLWTTSLAWPPRDSRGDWEKLSRFYAGLTEQHGEVEVSSPLPRRWQRRPAPEDAVRLSPSARDALAASIRELARSDRVAGDTPIRALAIQPASVQIVLACPSELLHQRVGRLKSRSATELSYAPGAGIGGAGTWGRGFWWARLGTEELLAAVESFVLSE